MNTEKTMKLALYRKFRPQKFVDVISQDHITKVLAGQVKAGTVSHAYLFAGTRGTGKTTVAKILAKAVNCLNPKDGDACCVCEACKQFCSTTDVIEIDGASNNGVDEIRALRENIKFAPMHLKYKIYIIDEVHMLTTSAFNALLKTLEEPPAHAIFVLATTEIHKLPATILSRCIKFVFRLISQAELIKLLEKIFVQESIKCDEPSIALMASLGEGSVRDSLTIAQMCADYCNNNITFDKAQLVLAVVSIEQVLEIAQSLIKKDTKKVFEIYQNLVDSGKGTNTIAKELIKIYKSIFIAKNTKNANDILSLPVEIFAKVDGLAKEIQNETLINTLDLLLSYESAAKASIVGGEVLFEAMLIKILGN